MSNFPKSKDELINTLLEKIEECRNLLPVIKKMPAITGQQKLQRKIEAELRFFQKLTKHTEILKEDHIRSTNLYHLSGIVKCCLEMTDVVKILAPFTYDQPETAILSSYPKRIEIDVVADSGNTWVKVVARNPFYLLQASLGAGRFGRKTIVTQLKDIIDCANQNPCMFTAPRIMVCFTAGVTKQLKLILQEMDIEVIGFEVQENMTKKYQNQSVISLSDIGACQSFPDTGASSSKLKHCAQIVPKSEFEKNIEYFNTMFLDKNAIASNLHQELNLDSIPKDTVLMHFGASSSKLKHCAQIVPKSEFEKNIEYFNTMFLDKNAIASNLNQELNLDSIPKDTVLNLDVSTMVAHVSNVTNGHCNAKFEERILSDQAKREQIHPVRDVFNNLFRGRTLVCCTTAYSDFMEILSTVGGDEEKKRSLEMFKQITVVPDNPSKNAILLRDSSKIKKRSRIVFGTGDNLKAITVTANLGFVRSTQSQGIKFVVFVHESRALTEQKELPKPPEIS